MSDLKDLYQEVIIDHSKRPRNFHKPEGANRQGEGFNPLCGDKVKVFLWVQDGVIRDIGFEGSGCAISTASASLMTEILKSRKIDEVEPLFRSFQELVTGKAPSGTGGLPGAPELGKLAVFSGVYEFPARVKCATLAWHTLRSALKNDGQVARTE